MSARRLLCVSILSMAATAALAPAGVAQRRPIPVGVIAADTGWYQTPYRVLVGRVPLDVADRSQGGGVEGDDFGHAAPFFADVDDDGRRDLVVGSYAGRF